MKKLLTIFILMFQSHTGIAQKSLMMWINATANYERLSTKESIKYYFKKCKEIGVTDVVIDVKPISGEVLYQSKIADFLNEWKGFTRPADFDLLNTAIEEGHAIKIKVHAALLLGSVYVEQYKQNSGQFTKAMQMCKDKTNGLMIFDLVHIVEKNWWDTIKNLQRS